MPDDQQEREIVHDVHLIAQESRTHVEKGVERVIHHSKWWRAQVIKTSDRRYEVIRHWGRIGAKTSTDKKPRVFSYGPSATDWVQKEERKKRRGSSHYHRIEKSQLDLLKAVTSSLSKDAGGTSARLNLKWAWVHANGTLEYLDLADWTELPAETDIRPGIWVSYDRKRGTVEAVRVLFLSDGAYKTTNAHLGAPVEGRDAEVAEAIQEAIAESGVL